MKRRAYILQNALGKTRGKVWLALVLVAAVAGGTRAHVGERVYSIYELRDDELPDLHDGSLEDWRRVFLEPTLMEFDFGSLPVGDGAPIGRPDLGVNIYLGWSASQNKIYAAVERLDDVYINTYEGGDPTLLWRYDSVNVMVDGDHSGGNYVSTGHCGPLKAALDSEVLSDECRSSFQAQQYTAVAVLNGQLSGYFDNGGHWALLPPYADVGGFVEEGTPHRSVVEMAVTPFDEFRWEGAAYSRASALWVGKVVGLQISLPDFDVEEGKYHGFSTLEGQRNTWREADTFVDAVLVGSDPEIAVALDDPAIIDVLDFRLKDENGNGVAEAGERVEVAFVPREDRVLPDSGVFARLRSDDEYVRLLGEAVTMVSDRTFAPLAFTYAVEAIGRNRAELFLELAQEGESRVWPLVVEAHSPRLAPGRLEVSDAPPQGNGDGLVQPGETVQLTLVLETNDELAVKGMEIEVRSLDGKLREVEARSLRFALERGRLRSRTPLQYVATRAIAEGDALALAVTSRGWGASWTDTLYVRAGAGGDEIPPLFVGQVQQWQGREGLTLLYPRLDFVEGGEVVSVVLVLVAGADGGEIARWPLHRRGEYWAGFFSAIAPGKYHYALAAVDGDGNGAQTARQPVEIEVLSAGEKSRSIIGGGERGGNALGPYKNLVHPGALVADRRGRLYIADTGNHRVRRIESDGTLMTVAGNEAGYAGDGGPAQDALLRRPAGMAFDGAGNLYVADTDNHRIRSIDRQGIITTVAGSGERGFGGDGGPARQARLNAPTAMAVDAAGVLYIADTENHRIRRVDRQGIITTFAGGAERESAVGAGNPATQVLLRRPGGVLVDGVGNVFFADSQKIAVRKVDRDGILADVVERSGAALWTPTGLAADAQGNLYIGDVGLQRVLMIAAAVEPRATAVVEEAEVRAEAVLRHNYPNPFNAATIISFSISLVGRAKVELYDVLGQRVRLLVDKELAPGDHRVEWDGRDGRGRAVAAGVYFYRLQAGELHWSRRLVLVR